MGWEGPVVHVIMVSQPGMTSWWICVWKIIVPVFLPRHDALLASMMSWPAIEDMNNKLL